MKKYVRPILIVTLVLLADQLFKTWVKTHMEIGQEIKVASNWFIIHFTENNGMAFGMEFGGEYGKLFLTLFRIVAVGVIIYLLIYCIQNRFSKGLVICVCLILAGAIGNIIDSAFYGVIYNYAPLFHGRVVDMLYFPIIQTRFPMWVPSVGGDEFIFFNPVFNIADSSISTGVIAIIVFQKRYFKNTNRPKVTEDDPNSEVLEV